MLVWVTRIILNDGICCGRPPIYMSKERLSFSFAIVTSRKLILLSISSSIVNFKVGIRLLNILNASYMLVVVLLYTMRISSYLLTPRCRVLLEKLTGLQLVKKFPAFHGTRRFITSLTSVRHLSLSWASPIQSIYPHPTSCRFILILSPIYA